MRKLTTFASVLALVAFAGTTAFADGLSQGLADPVIAAPAMVLENWTGAYAGLSYGRTGTEPTEPTMDDVGGFAGYRQNFGAFVVGGELSVNQEVTSLEAQAGYDLGRMMPYVFAGYGDVADEQAMVYGAGADFLVATNVFMGVKYTTGDFDNSDVSATQLRVGVKF